MYRIYLLLVFSSISLSSGTAHSQSASSTDSGLYVGGSGAAAIFWGIEGADYDLGFAASGLAGFEWWPSWRVELELSYEEAEFENSADETSLFRLSGSLYKDLDQHAWGNWVPYAGGGLGIVDIDVGNDENNTEFSGHAEIGLSGPLGVDLEFVPGVRVEYIVLDDIDDQVITQLRAGLRWSL